MQLARRVTVGRAPRWVIQSYHIHSSFANAALLPTVFAAGNPKVDGIAISLLHMTHAHKGFPPACSIGPKRPSHPSLRLVPAC